MQYVYRYLYRNGKTAYVGITNNLDRRIIQHRNDKLKGLDCEIQFFPVKHRADAEMIETYLICKSDACKENNVSKTKKGNASFLDNISFPWVEYPCSDYIEPFVIDPLKTEIKTEVKYETRYVDGRSITQMEQLCLQWFKERHEYYKEEISAEREILIELCALYCGYKPGLKVSFSDLAQGIYLHNKRLLAIENVKKEDCMKGSIKYKENLFKAQKIFRELQEFEESLGKETQKCKSS